MWKYQNTDELYHYGVLGMKWGIHRARKALGSSSATADKKKKAVASLNKHKTKINNKLNDLQDERKYLDKRRSKDIQKNEFKENKYRTKANKLRRKKYGIFTSASKAEELEFRATKLDLKADKLKSKITNTKLQIQKNEEMQKIFNTGLNEVNNLLVRQGRSYLRNLN